MTPNERAKKWRKDNPEKARAIASTYRGKRKREGKVNLAVKARKNVRLTNPSKALLDGIRSRAPRKGIPFNIDETDIPIPEYCPVLGVPIVLEPFRHDHGPSVDRILPELGYVKGNVRIICNLANRIKSNASLEQLRLIVAYVERETTAH